MWCEGLQQVMILDKTGDHATDRCWGKNCHCLISGKHSKMQTSTVDYAQLSRYTDATAPF